MSLAKVLARGQITLPRDVRRAACIEPGDTVMLLVTGHGTVQLKVLPRLRLADALERYRIEGPVDFESDRAQWQTQAAAEVLGTADD